MSSINYFLNPDFIMIIAEGMIAAGGMMYFAFQEANANLYNNSIVARRAGKNVLFPDQVHKFCVGVFTGLHSI